MSKKLSLSIPTPCHEDWNKMTASEHGRFCKACQKQVIDFTSMSDSQLVAFFKKPAGSVCGRFREEQLNNEINIPGKRIPWIKYFFQFTIPAFLISMKATAQGEVKPSVITTCVKTPNPVKLGKVAANPQGVISGKVRDDNNYPIPFATVMIRGSANGVQADAEGLFQLKVDRSARVTLQISAVGYNTKELVVVNDTLNVVMERTFMGLAGEVVVTSPERIKKLKQKEKTKSVLSKVRDTIFSKFTIHPNPVLQGQAVTLNASNLPLGEYNLTITDMAGNRVQQFPDISIEKNAFNELTIPAYKPGMYVVTYQNKKTGKLYSQKFIVQ